MKIKIYRVALIAVIILVIISTIGAIYYKSVYSSTKVKELPVKVEYEYVLKSVNGDVCVFEHDNDKPVRVLNIYLDSLPIADRMELVNGIRLKDDNALAQAIEDFES